VNRTLVIGLDGASYHLVERWKDDLPNLGRLMENGTSGILRSVLPPRSIPAWYCFATGMNPAKLGVFGFSQRRPGTYDYTFANSTYCQMPMFWEWAGQYGVKSGIILVPGTYPPRPTNGFLVSGWPAPINRGKLIYTDPADLSGEIDTVLGAPLEFASSQALDPQHDAEMASELSRLVQMHTTAAEHLLQTRDWQLGVVVLAPLDRASHQFWRHMDPGHPQHDELLVDRYGDALRASYVEHDASVGRLLATVDDDDSVFVVSDHGFGPARRSFYINEWLRQQGYLVLRDGTPVGQASWRTKLVGQLAAPLFKLNSSSETFRRLTEPFKRRLLANALRDRFVRAKHGGRVRLNHLPVDWQHTRAYSPDESSLCLNLRGRDPQGVVEPGEEARILLHEIIEGLTSITDPQTGGSLSVRSYLKEDIYAGPHLVSAPELTLVVDDFNTMVMAELGSGTLFDEDINWSGTHNQDGLFVASGPSIVDGIRIDLDLVDIAPTILHLAGLPIPAESDGEVRSEVFRHDSSAFLQPVNGAPVTSFTQPNKLLSAEAQAEVEQQLRRLGYLE